MKNGFISQKKWNFYNIYTKLNKLKHDFILRLY